MLIRPSATSYSVAAHDDLLQQWQATQREPGPLQLDLSQVEFFDPYGMAGLTLFLNHLPPSALPAQLLLKNWPSDPAGPPSRLYSGPVAYLSRMNFWDAVAPCLDVGPERLPARPARVVDRSVLIEITILRTHEAISAMLRKAGEILQNLSYIIAARGHILEVLSELCSNVLLHAQTEFGCVAAMQTYTREGTRYIVMGIGDAGIGVRRSLAANATLANRLRTDSQALIIAVQPGASRYDTVGHGGGLPRVLEIARRYNGRLAFRSGTGSLIYHGKEDHRRTFEGPPLLGTQLRISLPEAVMKTDRPTDATAAGK